MIVSLLTVLFYLDVSVNGDLTIILNSILEYLRPSEAEIEDCGMRKRA